MRINKVIVGFFANFLTLSCAHSEGMCAGREAVIFNCELEKSISSLCVSRDAGTLYYRNGITNKINLEISDNLARNGKIFYFSSIPYGGGGEAHIRFSNGGFTYYLYDKTVKTDDGPTFSAGIVVYKGERKISDLACGNDASIHQGAYYAITKESYRNIDSK